MRSALISLLVAGAVCGGATGSVRAATGPAPVEIYLQRASDGRVVLTDRPSPTAVTERSWQVEREDPEAARRRALEMQREAAAVSDRIQRRIDDRKRLEAELDESRLARRDRDLATQIARARSDDAGPVIVAPFGWQPGLHRSPLWIGSPPPRRPPHAPWRAPRVKAPASPESR
jgi:hypothetical protein